MGANQSIQVANAFPQDILVRVQSEKIEEHLTSRKANAGATVKGVGATVEAGYEKVEKTNFHHMIEEGFGKIPSQEVTTFKPSINHTKTAYATVLYYDAEGKENFIFNNVPCSNSHSVIVTATGGVTDTKDKTKPWIDKNNKDHKNDPCGSCKTMLTVCSMCLVESRMAQVEISLGILSTSKIQQSLITTIQTLREADVMKDKKDAEELMDQLMEVAKHYWTLEAETERSVRDVKAYGENLKEAAKDYLEDNILDDFWQEMSDMENVKQSVQKANNEHKIIKGKVDMIGKTAKIKSETAGEKARKAQSYVEEHSDIVVGSRLLAKIRGLEGCNSLPSKIVAGGGIVYAGVYDLIHAGPYLWYKTFSNYFDAFNQGTLKVQFESIADQMGMVEEHLGSITNALWDIEEHLNKSLKAEEKVMNATTPDKRMKMVKRVIEQAQKLMDSCDCYNGIVKKKDSSQKMLMN